MINISHFNVSFIIDHSVYATTKLYSVPYRKGDTITLKVEAATPSAKYYTDNHYGKYEIVDINHGIQYTVHESDFDETSINVDIYLEKLGGIK